MKAFLRERGMTENIRSWKMITKAMYEHYSIKSLSEQNKNKLIIKTRQGTNTINFAPNF